MPHSARIRTSGWRKFLGLLSHKSSSPGHHSPISFLVTNRRLGSSTIFFFALSFNAVSYNCPSDQRLITSFTLFLHLILLCTSLFSFHCCIRLLNWLIGLAWSLISTPSPTPRQVIPEGEDLKKKKEHTHTKPKQDPDLSLTDGSRQPALPHHYL